MVTVLTMVNNSTFLSNVKYAYFFHSLLILAMPCWSKQSITVEEAVALVTCNISLIRQAKNKDQVIKYYKTAKVTKKNVDTTSANQPMLAQLAAAYREHAEVMKSWGCHQMALESWKKADEIL